MVASSLIYARKNVFSYTNSRNCLIFTANIVQSHSYHVGVPTGSTFCRLCSTPSSFSSCKSPSSTSQALFIFHLPCSSTSHSAFVYQKPPRSFCSITHTPPMTFNLNISDYPKGHQVSSTMNGTLGSTLDITRFSNSHAQKDFTWPCAGSARVSDHYTMIIVVRLET
jgi:hypothetical protein